MLALSNFLQAKVRHMRRQVNVYSGSIIRSDGHFKLARRIVVFANSESARTLHPWNVILAWVGVDGSLLDVPRPAKGESIEDLLLDLDDVVTDLKDDRLEGGLSIEEAAPAANTTDSYGKHRLKYDSFFRRKFPEHQVQVQSVTPRGDAVGAAVSRTSEGPTKCCGDPSHDWFAFRRCIPIHANDARNLSSDHEEGLRRLSLEPMERCEEGLATGVSAMLSRAGQGLLRCGVTMPKEVFQRGLATDDVGAGALRAFLSLPYISEAPIWSALFGSPEFPVTQPPRGVVARVATWADAPLHRTMQLHGYHTLEAFKQEMQRVRAWYKPGRKLDMMRIGIRRLRNQSARVEGRRTAWNAKTEAHYRRLFKDLRLEGLWKWHEVAMEILAAGIPMHTGTVPAERFWSYLIDIWPPATKNVTFKTYMVMARICFLRYNYGLYNTGFLPPWCRGDPLLAHRIDGLASAVKALCESSNGAIEMLFSAFETGES
jgi:hypothetical protein